MSLQGNVVAAIAGLAVIAVVFQDAFETVVLPRRVTRQFRLTSLFYRYTWGRWTSIARRIGAENRRQNFLGYFGPLSLILLLGCWAFGLIVGFALVQFGLGGHMQIGNEPLTFGRILYHSGETFFTLGYGDILPTSGLARALSVLESGMGFAFLGVVIGYIPVIYASFSRREIQISMLDARGGSPPTALELLVRLAGAGEGARALRFDQSVLDQVFRDWEHWAAELLESHISYPVLSFFRSQHSNQSWLSALTAMLDVTSLVVSGIEGIHSGQARLTFAMARHAAIDLAQLVSSPYDPHARNRLPEAEFELLRAALAEHGLQLLQGEDAAAKLTRMRSLYEPYVHASSKRLLFPLPPWRHAGKKKDNWQSGPWERIIQAESLRVLGQKPAQQRREDHF